MRMRRTKKQEMNLDEKFAEDLRKEEIEIPAELEPDRMMEKLTERLDEKKAGRNEAHRSPIRRTAVMVAAAAVIFAVGILTGTGIRKGDFLPGKGSPKAGEATIENVEENAAGNRAEKDKNTGKEGTNSITCRNYQRACRMLSLYQEKIGVTDSVFVAEDGDGAVSERNAAGAVTDSRSAETAQENSADGVTDESSVFSRVNTRTEGVDEADIVRTDGKFIYVYDSSTAKIRIYSASAGETEEIGKISLPSDLEWDGEFFISGERLAVLGNRHLEDEWNGMDHETASTVDAGSAGDADAEEKELRESRENAVICIYDIQDPRKPELLAKYSQGGTYQTARLKDGILYVFSEERMKDLVQEDDRFTYVPSVDGKLVPDDCLVVQESCLTNAYTVVSTVRMGTADIISTYGFLAGSDTMYMSGSDIYLADQEYDRDHFRYLPETEILRISYKNGKLKKEAVGTVPGTLHDDYSLDAYQGYLRLVTTYRNEDYERYNALYVLDGDLSRVGMIRGLAKGEDIKSARFMGNTAYFVTYRNTDPLFSVDLSDPEEPKMLGYLKIPGFSAYLHPWGDGLLLGIGYDTDVESQVTGLKLTMFDVSDPADVKEMDTTVISGLNHTEVAENPNAFLLDEEDHFFGFSGKNTGYDWNSVTMTYEEKAPADTYFIYTYDRETGFRQLLRQELTATAEGMAADADQTRGVVAGGYLYIVETNGKIRGMNVKEMME